MTSAPAATACRATSAQIHVGNFGSDLDAHCRPRVGRGTDLPAEAVRIPEERLSGTDRTHLLLSAVGVEFQHRVVA